MADADTKDAFVGILFDQASMALGFCGRFSQENLRRALEVVQEPGFWQKDVLALNSKAPIWIRCLGRLVELMLIQHRQLKGKSPEMTEVVRIMLYAAIEARQHPYCWVEVTEERHPERLSSKQVLRGFSLEVHDLDAVDAKAALDQFTKLDKVKACEARQNDPTYLDQYSRVAGHA